MRVNEYDDDEHESGNDNDDELAELITTQINDIDMLDAKNLKSNNTEISNPPIIITTDGNTRKAVKNEQHVAYRYHGELLEDLCFFEYVSMIRHVKKKHVSTSSNSIEIKPGREPNL